MRFQLPLLFNLFLWPVQLIEAFIVTWCTVIMAVVLRFGL